MFMQIHIFMNAIKEIESRKKFIPFNTSYNEHYNLGILYILICSIIYLVEARIYIFSTNHAFHTVC